MKNVSGPKNERNKQNRRGGKIQAHTCDRERESRVGISETEMPGGLAMCTLTPRESYTSCLFISIRIYVPANIYLHISV